MSHHAYLPLLYVVVVVVVVDVDVVVVVDVVDVVVDVFLFSPFSFTVFSLLPYSVKKKKYCWFTQEFIQDTIKTQ